MKQRISISDLEKLSAKQQNNLRDYWTPEKYDIAVSKFITNVETDEFRWIEYAIGDIEVKNSGRIVLKDLRLTDGYIKINEGEEFGNEDFELQEPASFRKDESLPLLNIGQMISMLSLIDKRKYHFYLLSGNSSYACEIGDFNSELKSDILNKSSIKDELVDVLWTTLIAAL